MHDVSIRQGEQPRDSEGLLISGLPRPWQLHCETCGWERAAGSAEDAIVLQQTHGKQE